MFKQLSHLLKSGEVKRLLENFFSLSILKLVNAILPFVTLPYLIKVLGFQQYGAIVLALSLITYFQAITDYGFNLSATREIAQHRHSNKQLIYIYNKTMISKIILLIFSLLCLCGLILFVPQFRADFLVYSLMCLMLIGQTLFPEWFFRGVEQMRYITILDLAVKFSFTVGVFVLIKKPEDYWIYPLLYGTGFFLVSMIAHILILKKYKINFVFIKLNKILTNLKKNSSLFINQFMPNFYNNTTTFLIGMLLGNVAAGLFGAIRQITNILSVFNAVISMVFFPYLVRKKEKFYLFSKFYLVGFFVLTISLILIHPLIFKWLGVVDNNLSLIFNMLSFGVFFIAVYSLYSTNYLIPRGYDRVVLKNTLFISMLGLISSYPLIKVFGLIGGAINIAFAQFLMGISSYFYYRKVIKKL
ncbi:oligosaccharide flippase family protein [Acinetobacter sp. 226]|jgi:PST family polysaccharide transporter|uniref:oligosaccharide flippase family protein n=1 Tax=Acinetobacter sp. 226 TaxID=3114699 RepID=UPI003A8ABB6D